MLNNENVDQWRQLTPQQRREKREARFLNPLNVKFVDEDAQRLYQVRAKRLLDVFNLKEPDRVPVALHLGSLPLRHYGIKYHDAIQNFRKAILAFNRFNTKFAADLDNFSSPGLLVPGNAFELLDYRMYSWPGHGLPPDAGNIQFRESEYMKADEYDDLIQNPADFWLRSYFPRIFGTFESLSNMSPLTDLVEIPTGQLMALADPKVQQMLRSLLQAGKALQKRTQLLQTYSIDGAATGFPPAVHYLCIAPFDILGDTLRGTQGIMMDMYRRPDKLLEAIEVICNFQIKSTIKRAQASPGLIVTFPLHKGADGWMSQKQFEKFYWPSLKKSIDALVNEGLIVFLFAEGNYDSRLETVNEFPKGAIHWWFDKIDMARAKKILGSKCSISGNLPASLLMTGTPLEVKAYCRNLIEVCGQNGGYMLSEGAAEVEAKIENLLAMTEAAKEYGVYRK
jgi:hypothetical protein